VRDEQSSKIGDVFVQDLFAINTKVGTRALAVELRN
jgi:hypothetical protein